MFQAVAMVVQALSWALFQSSHRNHRDSWRVRTRRLVPESHPLQAVAHNHAPNENMTLKNFFDGILASAHVFRAFAETSMSEDLSEESRADD